MDGNNTTSRRNVMKSRSLFGLVLIVALLAMFGCGGGDGAPAAPAPTAVVKIATTNTAPTLVNGVNAMLNYSSSKYSLPPNSVDGFNPKVIASGNGLVANTLVFGHLSSAGHVRIGLISAAGITGGGVCHGHLYHPPRQNRGAG